LCFRRRRRKGEKQRQEGKERNESAEDLAHLSAQRDALAAEARAVREAVLVEREYVDRVLARMEAEARSLAAEREALTDAKRWRQCLDLVTGVRCEEEGRGTFPPAARVRSNVHVTRTRAFDRSSSRSIAASVAPPTPPPPKRECALRACPARAVPSLALLGNSRASFALWARLARRRFGASGPAAPP